MPVIRILNIAPSPEIAHDPTFTNAATDLRFDPRDLISNCPESIDLREPWWDVGDQGSTGSCVGWAVADSLLRWHFARDGRIPAGTHLSPRFIWMAAKESDAQRTVPTTFIEKAFTSIKAGLEVARTFGAVEEDVLPFASPQMYPGTVESFYELAGRLKLARYYNLGRDFDQVRAWLYSRGPVLFRMIVDDSWLHATPRTARLDNFGTGRFGHAAVLVGYSSDTFVARNSWGVNWGDRGFAYLGEQYARDAIQETYGVAV